MFLGRSGSKFELSLGLFPVAVPFSAVLVSEPGSFNLNSLCMLHDDLNGPFVLSSTRLRHYARVVHLCTQDPGLNM